MIFLFFLILAILLEATLTSIPIVLDLLLVFFILKRKSRMLVYAFVSGMVLDIFRVRALGLTGIFFIVFILLVFLYEKKFEIVTYPFVFFASFLGGIGYLYLFSYGYVLEQALGGSIIAILMFKGLSGSNIGIQNSKVKIQKYLPADATHQALQAGK